MERPSDNVSAQLSGGVAPFKTYKKFDAKGMDQWKNRCCTHTSFGSCGLLHVGVTSANKWVCQTRFVCVAHASEYRKASAFVSPGQLFSSPLALRSLGRSWILSLFPVSWSPMEPLNCGPEKGKLMCSHTHESSHLPAGSCGAFPSRSDLC